MMGLVGYDVDNYIPDRDVHWDLREWRCIRMEDEPGMNRNKH